MTAMERKESMQMRISKKVHGLLLAEARRTHRTITGMLELIIDQYNPLTFKVIQAIVDQETDGLDRSAFILKTAKEILAKAEGGGMR